MRDFLGRGVLNLDLVPLSDEPSFEFETRFLPGVTITTGMNTPHTGQTHDISRESDDFVLVWGQDGGCTRQHGKEVESAEGAALLFCGEKVNSWAKRTMSHRTLRIARGSLVPVLPTFHEFLAKPITRRSSAFRLLDEYLTLLCLDEWTHGPEVSQAIALHICDLVALAIGTTADESQLAGARGGRVARLAVVKRWVFAHLREQSLSVTTAAKAHQVSPRYIQMLFEEQGITFSEFVRRERLALAYRLLSNASLAGRSISSIAFDSGFNDLSYFNRQFRSAFGETPSDVRLRSLHRQR